MKKLPTNLKKSFTNTELSANSSSAPVLLQVLVCTCGEGIRRIVPSGLPRVEGVEYLISWQLAADDIPGALSDREDVKIVSSPGKGLSNNRNSAFEASTAPYLLIADDDLSFHAEGLRAIIDNFSADSDLGLLTFRSVRDEGQVYPPDAHDLAVPFRFYEPVSFEIAVRRSVLQSSGVRFSPLAGIGAPYLCAAEENLFVWHLLHAGVKGRFRAFDCAVHPGPTTSVRRAAEAPMLRTKGAYAVCTQNPLKALVRLPLLAVRSAAPSPKALLWLIQGWYYGIKNRKWL